MKKKRYFFFFLFHTLAVFFLFTESVDRPEALSSNRRMSSGVLPPTTTTCSPSFHKRLPPLSSNPFGCLQRNSHHYRNDLASRRQTMWNWTFLVKFSWILFMKLKFINIIFLVVEAVFVEKNKAALCKFQFAYSILNYFYKLRLGCYGDDRTNFVFY